MKIRNTYLELVHNDNTSVHEPIILDFIDSIEPNKTFYDLGSCLGYFSIYAGKKNLDVYSFEADPKNYDALVTNINHNDVTVKHFNIAISSGEFNEVEFRIGQDYTGGHHKTVVTKNFSASDGIINENFKKIKVPSYSLDQIIEKNNLPYPENIKIDIDGSEYDFLIGSKKSLSHIKFMIIELYKKSIFYNEIMELIEKNGFRVYREDPINQPGCESCIDLYNVWFIK